MRYRLHASRRGAALLVALTLLTVIGVIMASITWQSLAQRRFLEQRERRLQAEWLARGGVQHARAEVAAGKEPTSETWRPIDGAEVKIDVVIKDGAYQVRSDATFRADEPHPVVRREVASVDRPR